MRKGLTVSAPAKINLGLRVFPRRDDGYHDIESIFTTVALCDFVTVELCDGLDERNTCVVDCVGERRIQLPDDNTFSRAYKAFCVLTGNDRGVHVTVDKKIPAGGGLGGGSSDSSSFIKSIDTMLGTRLTESDLDKISAQVGSDVYFFSRAKFSEAGDGSMEKRFAALVGGRGEQVSPLEPRNDFSVLLVFPGETVPTPMAYGLVDMAGTRRRSGDESLAEIYGRPVRDWTFVNDFTVPVGQKFPRILNVLDAVKTSGADFVDMSGSGSTVFGVFEDRDRAEFAKGRLDRDWRTVLV
ncbi:MAG: hypothetical protein IKP60_12755 [Treponema sp.]|nr:hypothetical protein [Treponema sp.]